MRYTPVYKKIQEKNKKKKRNTNNKELKIILGTSLHSIQITGCLPQCKL